jgi:hypothetical protein
MPLALQRRLLLTYTTSIRTSNLRTRCLLGECARLVSQDSCLPTRLCFFAAVHAADRLSAASPGKVGQPDHADACVPRAGWRGYAWHAVTSSKCSSDLMGLLAGGAETYCQCQSQPRLPRGSQTSVSPQQKPEEHNIPCPTWAIMLRAAAKIDRPPAHHIQAHPAACAALLLVAAAALCIPYASAAVAVNAAASDLSRPDAQGQGCGVLCHANAHSVGASASLPR